MKCGVVLLLGLATLAAQEKLLVVGEVLNAATGAGVAGAAVQIHNLSSKPQPSLTATSGADGKFQISAPAGDYLAVVNPLSGFSPVAPKQFHLDAAASPLRLALALPPWSQIRGRVVDQDGQPIENAMVELFLAYGEMGDRKTTGKSGEFVFNSVAAGSYKLRAKVVQAGSPLAERLTVITPLHAKAPEGESWVTSYYPNGLSPAEAVPIVVRAGAGLPEFELRVRTAPVFTLRGTVRDERGGPCAGARLSVQSEIGWGTAEAAATSQADGSFAFAALRAGEWKIVAEKQAGGVLLKAEVAVTMPSHAMRRGGSRSATWRHRNITRWRFRWRRLTRGR